MKNSGITWATKNGITVFAKLTAEFNHHFYNLRRARGLWSNEHLKKNTEK